MQGVHVEHHCGQIDVIFEPRRFCRAERQKVRPLFSWNERSNRATVVG